MLHESLAHAQEDVTRRLLTEARVDAERVVLATRAALSADVALLVDGEEAMLENAVAAVETAAADTDRDVIMAAIEALDHAAQPFAQRRMDRSISAALGGKSIDAIDAELKNTEQSGST